VGIPLKDTLKETMANGRVVQTPDRNRFWLAQTPQVFTYSAILEAYRALPASAIPTDDGQALELAGRPVQMITGSSLNIKITTPEDVSFAEAILQTTKGSQL
jgi:2-C-methyl-D-erythritol 4-phosphate cytidylyltransferase